MRLPFALRRQWPGGVFLGWRRRNCRKVRPIGPCGCPSATEVRVKHLMISIVSGSRSCLDPPLRNFAIFPVRGWNDLAGRGLSVRPAAIPHPPPRVAGHKEAQLAIEPIAPHLFDLFAADPFPSLGEAKRTRLRLVQERRRLNLGAVICAVACSSGRLPAYAPAKNRPAGVIGVTVHSCELAAATSDRFISAVTDPPLQQRWIPATPAFPASPCPAIPIG